MTRCRTILLLCATLIALPASGERLNGIVLRVNSRIATLQDYQERRSERVQAILSSDLSQDEKSHQLEVAGSQVLKDFYEELLLLSRADQLAIRASDREIERAIAETRERMGVRNDQEFEQALEVNGMDLEEFRRRMERNLLMQEVVGREITSQIQVGDEEIRRYWRDHQDEFQVPRQARVQEIVVLEGGAAGSEELIATAERLAEELRNGADLATVASREEPSGTTTGVIDLGWVRPEDLDPDLAAAIDSLEAGQTSSPILGRGGFHLLQVLETREPYVRPLAEAQGEIRARERQRLFQKTYAEYLEKMEKVAYLVVDAPEEARGFLTERGLESGTEALVRDAEAKTGDEAEEEPSDDEAGAPPDAP